MQEKKLQNNMVKKPISGISIIVPAYNEEGNISDAIKNLVSISKKYHFPYEILVIDDGSQDKTSQRVLDESKKNRNVRLIYFKDHKGLGYAIRCGLEEAKMNYVTVFPGDNDLDPMSIVDLINKRESADIVVSYLGKSDTRRLLRRIASITYVALVSKLFNLKLQYYNGPFICKTKLVKNMKLVSSGFTIYCEMKIRLIKAGHTYEEIQFLHTGRQHGKSKALTLRSIFNTLIATFLIWRDIEK